MSVVVCFVKNATKGLGPLVGIGECRVRETITVPNTTTASLQADEVAIVLNGEAAGVLVAWGTTPDAATATSTSLSTAGVPVPSGGYSVPIMGKVGDKLNIKAIS